MRKSTMPSKFDLAGIEMHNLLGFLSLLGLLKTLEIARPRWYPCVEWPGISPQIQVAEDVQEQDVSVAAVDGLIKLGKKMDFGSYQMKISLDEFKDIQNTLNPDILVALGSDGALENERGWKRKVREGGGKENEENGKGDKKKKEKENELTPTPLCMMFGSGHQLFLSRLHNATSIGGERRSVESEISAALFEEWNYKDKNSKIMFRWDPKEYRPHAYRNKDPSNSPSYTMNGANRLAAVGFTSYYCVPTNRGLATISCGKNSVLWPVWTPAISLASISSIMHHPDMSGLAASNDPEKDNSGGKLKAYGVRCVMKADLFWDDKFKNVGVAKQIQLTRKRQ